VTLEDQTVVAVEGNRRAPLFGGFFCPKGRALSRLHNNPDRLITSMKRQADGSHAPIRTERAIDEIAQRLREIHEKHFDRAIAGFVGNPGVEQIATAPMMLALLGAFADVFYEGHARPTRNDYRRRATRALAGRANAVRGPRLLLDGGRHPGHLKRSISARTLECGSKEWFTTAAA
jgi:anaerobic selenocysteine-containing dehydrogenase